MGLLAAGMKALLARQAAAAAGPLPLTYSRASTGQSVGLTNAWPGTSEFTRETKTPGASVSTAERDYLVPVASLVLGGSRTLPQKGDQVTDPNVLDPQTGLPMVFELMTSNGEPVWRFSDQQRTLYRCHTKRVT
ncbi:MAG: hypothetical protein JWO38_4881 [Gemmataceae bacterium]|nr:hypothetical protein [Gemmataceae bacterium]